MQSVDEKESLLQWKGVQTIVEVFVVVDILQFCFDDLRRIGMASIEVHLGGLRRMFAGASIPSGGRLRSDRDFRR